MGLFLSATGIVGAYQESVARVIGSYAAAQGGTFEFVEGTLEDRHVGVMAMNADRCTIIYPGDFLGWDEVSQHLSYELQTPAFSFHIHDSDLWMYQLFNNGELANRYNPIPDYWGDVDLAERSSWAGDADAIQNCIPSIEADQIREYLVPWTEEVLATKNKAYADDQFARGVDWQLIDFMGRLGFIYPVRDDGSLAGQTFRLRIRRTRLR